jgi:hypothetical protein
VSFLFYANFPAAEKFSFGTERYEVEIKLKKCDNICET